MKILYIIWNNVIPIFIQVIIKRILLIWKLWKLKIDYQSYKIITLWQLLQNFYNIDKTVYGSYNINLRWHIKVNKYTEINWPNTYIMAWDKWFWIIIWKFCSIAPWTTIISTNNHDYTKLTSYCWKMMLNKKNLWKEVIIWNDVWIWANTTILPWVNIWNWAVIWAWSVVNKDIPSYAIAAWNPAKVIKYRFDEKTIEKLENSKWWDWSIEKIKNNYNLEFIKNE